MIDRTQERFGVWQARLTADTGYCSAENLAWLVHEHGIEPHIPVFDKSARNSGTFARSDFVYDQERDRYICPGGKDLNFYQRGFAAPRTGVDKDGFMRYRARERDCEACPLKS